LHHIIEIPETKGEHIHECFLGGSHRRKEKQLINTKESSEWKDGKAYIENKG
jgi:hypothetical protein